MFLILFQLWFNTQNSRFAMLYNLARFVAVAVTFLFIRNTGFLLQSHMDFTL